MSGTTQIIIDLPEDVYQAVEKERQSRGESQNEFFLHAVQHLIFSDSDAVKRYVEGYRQQPESDEEVSEIRETSLATLAGEPWE